ncbi:hypothetical protein [Natronorubrum texcoconense]|uniref:Uncharacterized protein n=1 Tax=Natronorubrum texcoconense TaxID=1095776 RepID=A0A1G9G1J6_9EURY|nr:hypothetical protein [Natronorubrum texcoconense]SDK94552.1 hypothetical protein SAMN04515672_4382 [Natronorubrum texcoconense]
MSEIDQDRSSKTVTLPAALRLGWNLMRLRMAGRYDFTALGIHNCYDSIIETLDETGFDSKIRSDVEYQMEFMTNVKGGLFEDEAKKLKEIEMSDDETSDEEGIPDDETSDEEGIPDDETSDEEGIPDDETSDEEGIPDDETSDEEGMEYQRIKKQPRQATEFEKEKAVTLSVTWQRILTEELSEEVRITLQHRGAIDSERVMNDPATLFQDELWGALPEKSKSDLTESINALCFGLPTCSVLLSLRTVERHLQEWYRDETGRTIDDRTFGQTLSELDDQFEKDDRPLILSHLEYLKDRRNQVAHPELVPNEREAESTLIMVRETLFEIQSQLE